MTNKLKISFRFFYVDNNKIFPLVSSMGQNTGAKYISEFLNFSSQLQHAIGITLT